MQESTKKKSIWTIGHSTRSFDEFLEMLNAFGIKTLVDVRSFPGSRKFPHFNKENLAELLPKHKIAYHHLKNLGGRRKSDPDSSNTIWRNLSFRGYADYMQTPEFETAVQELEEIGLENPTAYMCSEAVWWRCHRSMISDFLKVKNWEVNHIMSSSKINEHPFTAPAKVENGKLKYGTKED